MKIVGSVDLCGSCQTRHKWPEEELKARVETIQERTYKLGNVATDALMDLISDFKTAKAAGLGKRPRPMPGLKSKGK